MLDLVAQRYGQRPSDLVGIADPRVALDFDAAIALRAINAASQQPDREDRYDEWGNCTDFSPIVH